MYRYDRPQEQVDNRVSITKLVGGALLFVGAYLALVVITL